MRPVIFSYSNLNIDPEFLTTQKRCFNAFGMTIVQIQDFLLHGEGLDRWVNHFADHRDVIAIFDVDAVCTDPAWLKETMSRCIQAPLVVGGLHNANHTAFSVEQLTEDYASPACMVFSVSTWKAARRWSKMDDLFRCRWHSDIQTAWDCAQTFSHIVREMGGVVETLMPVSVRQPMWRSKAGPMTGYGTDYGPCYHEWGAGMGAPERIAAFKAYVEERVSPRTLCVS